MGRSNERPWKEGGPEGGEGGDGRQGGDRAVPLGAKTAGWQNKYRAVVRAWQEEVGSGSKVGGLDKQSKVLSHVRDEKSDRRRRRR